MGIVISLLVSMLSIGITAYLLPGVSISSAGSALLAVVVLGVANAIVKPILLLLTLPINILTLGLFTFVINALIVLLASSIVPGFRVDGFLWALLFSLVLSLVSSMVGSLVK